MVKSLTEYLAESSSVSKVASKKYVISAVVDQGKATQNPVFFSKMMEMQSDISKAILYDHVESAEEFLASTEANLRRRSPKQNIKCAIETVHIDTVYKRINPIEDTIKKGG